MALEDKQQKLTWRAANPEWHPLIRELYASFKKSKHYSEFEQTDMAFVRVLAEVHSNALQNTVEPNAALLKMCFAEWKELGATLRERKRLELEAKKIDNETISAATLEVMAKNILNPQKNSEEE